MLDQEVYNHYKLRFEVWRQLDPECHRVTSPQEKFAAIIENRYEDAVVSFPIQPGDASHAAGPRDSRLYTRHEQKRQVAVELLAHPGFTDDLFALARNWHLDTHIYEVDPVSFWFQEGLGGGFCWDCFLLWLSVEYFKRHGDTVSQSKRRLARAFLEDLDGGAVRRGLRAISEQVPDIRFAADVRRFSRGHGLSALWDRSIRVLLLSGVYYVPFDDCRIVLMRDDAETRLFLEVFPETRKDDVGDKWQDVARLAEELFPGRPRRRRARPQMNRDLHTLKARRAGRSIDQILEEDGLLEESLSWEEQVREEDALAERLETGVKRLTRSQARTLASAVAPSLPKWVQELERQSGQERTEWHF